MASIYSARPSSSFGYWRGGGSDGMPLAYGQGSRMGQANSGVGVFPPGSGGGGTGGGAWHPTVIYLLVFVVAELVIFKLLERALR
ncbi:MAG TPA: hypothetical protein VEH31_12120 [Streptosporangiaceae bacterium]|nr:hypothetical protein [Streptosporangiaceae bacterium]